MANRTYEYNPTGGSPVINVTAGAELKTAVAVLLTKDGAKIPEAGKEATGRLRLEISLLLMQRDYARRQQQGSTS